MPSFRTLAVASLLLAARTALAQSPGSVAGVVLDPLGARVPGAAVTLGGDARRETTSDAEGKFSFTEVPAGRYRITVSASGFETHESRSFYAAAGARVSREVTLSIGFQQQLVVTASGTEEQPAQVAAPVTVIGRQTLDDLAKPTILEALRLVPGAQVVQTGGRGGLTALFVRGGNANFNKVLLDGVPANQVGGAFNHADLLMTGVESVETLRDANSVVHGSDAMAGVVSIVTRRGQTRTPELTASVDAGNLGTHHEEATLGGTAGRLDYFGAYSHFSTDNDTPNSAWTNDSFVGRVGVALGAASDLSVVARRVSSDAGQPNAIRSFGIPDDAGQTADATYLSATAQAQFTPAWHGALRLASLQDDSEYLNPTPTGEAFDPFGFGANYLGRTVTVEGANGTSAIGRAILDFGGTYPSTFASRTKRRAAFAQTTWQVVPALGFSAGGRFEREEASSDAGTRSETERDNYGAFLEARAGVRRVYATAGVGYERNDVFGSAWTPRLSAAVYLREPSGTERLGDTKLVFSAGKGIKAPGLAQELSSLDALLETVPALGTRVAPIGPERARTLDVGLEQALFRGRLRLRASYFDNEYTDLVEFVSENALVSLGVPADIADATGFGAYVNSSSFTARGLELSAEGAAWGRLRATASYTYLDAEVTESFSSSALGPVENPAYPGVAIGAFGPLVGARPFRRPTHLASFLLTYASGPVQVSLAGALAGRTDDSTFLSDPFFGNSLLLPNADLNGGYQKIDLSGSYRVSRVKVYASVENLLDQDYTPSFGFPAPPRTFRAGVTGTVGGDGGRR